MVFFCVFSVPNRVLGLYLRSGEEKSTHHLQYMYLLLYLRRRRESELTPLERMVRDEVEEGSISWIPDGRCSTGENDETEDGEVEAAVKVLQDQCDSMAAVLASINERLPSADGETDV